MGDFLNSLFSDQEEDQVITPTIETPEVPEIPDTPEVAEDPLAGWDPLADYEEQISGEDRRSGEGVSGFFGDVASGLSSGIIRGGEMFSGAMEWMLPEGSGLETGARETKEALARKREGNTYLFQESESSEVAREDSAWNPRGWFHGGMESLGMLGAGAATGLGVGGIGFQFWGGTAQESYDEAIENERKGFGKKLTEDEKLVYANLRGFWEGGLEMIQAKIPFKIAKILPKSAKSNLIRAAVTRPGNPVLNVSKDLIKTIGAEVPMELSQEYLGQKTAFEFGQSDKDPTWDDIKAVIGPTIVMSGVLGFAGNVSAAGERKALHHALTAENVEPEVRTAAVMAIYKQVGKEDQELADMWLEQTAERLANNQPVALPLDQDVRTGEAELEAPQEGVERLEEALQVENAELRAKTAAKEEGTMAAEAEKVGPAPEGMAQEQFEELIAKAQDAVNVNGPGSRNITDTIAGVEQQQGPEAAAVFEQEVNRYSEELVAKRTQEKAAAGEPNAAGVIEPEVADTAQTVEGLDRQIDQLETTIEANPKHPQIQNFRNSLSKLKADRAVLLPETQTTPDTTAGQQETEIDAPEAIEAAPVKAYTPQDTKRSADFKETGEYEVGDSGFRIYRDTDQFSYPVWYVIGKDGKQVEGTFLYKKAEAIEKVNELAAENKVEVKPETKYSAKRPAGELAVDKEVIPDDMEITTKVTTADGKTTAETNFNAKKAVESMDDLLAKLAKILECVRT